MAKEYKDKIQENKEKADQIKREQAGEVINIIGDFIINKQKDLTTATIFLDFLKKVENGDVKNISITDFAIFAKFNIMGDAYNDVMSKAINNFYIFFQRITTAKPQEPLALKRYNFYLKGIAYLKEAFFITKDIPTLYLFKGKEGDPYQYATNNDLAETLNRAFCDFKKYGDEYFQFAEKLKTDFEAFSNNQKAKDEFKSEMLKLIEFYKIDAYDFFNKATFANAIVKFYYSKEAD